MDVDLPQWEQQHCPGVPQIPGMVEHAPYSFQTASASAASVLEQQRPSPMLPPSNPLRGSHPSQRRTATGAIQSAAAPALEELALMTDDDIAAMHGWKISHLSDKRRIADFRRETVLAATAHRRQPPLDGVLRHPPHSLQHHVPHVNHDRLPPPVLPEMASASWGASARHEGSSYDSRGAGDARGHHQPSALLGERDGRDRKGQPCERREEGDRPRGSNAAGRSQGAGGRRTASEAEQLRVSCTIVVEGVQAGVNEQDIAEWFSNEGRVVAVRLGTSGRVWLEFSAPEGAAAALSRFSKQRRGDPLKVSESRTAIRNNGLVTIQGGSRASPLPRGLPAGSRGRTAGPSRSSRDRSHEKAALQGEARAAPQGGVRQRSRSPLLRRQRSDSRSGGSGSSDRLGASASPSPVLRRMCSRSPEAAQGRGGNEIIHSRGGTSPGQEKADRKSALPPAWTPDTVQSNTETDSGSSDSGRDSSSHGSDDAMDTADKQHHTN